MLWPRKIQSAIQIAVYLCLLGFFLLSIFLMTGEEAERRVWAASPSTLHLYSTEQVCSTVNGDHVLNCGHCGHCSNVQDIRIYHETAESLTTIMTNCARNNFLWGEDTLRCLQKASGLSTECAKCWVGNYECNTQHCLKTCVKHRFFPFLPSWRDWNSAPLDPCIACDEKLCGPGFVECAGANRRRAGIVSDIQRDDGREICDRVDWDWILSSPQDGNANIEAKELPLAQVPEL